MSKSWLGLLGFVLISVVSPAAAEEIRIGWIGPLTGDSAVLGVDSLQAIQMAIEEINAQGGISGNPLKLVAEDDQYSSARTVGAYKKLVSADNVKAIFVITYGGLFAIADRAERDGVILVDPLDCNQRIGALNQNVFCVAKMTEGLGTLLADHAIEHKNLPAGLLYFESDPFPKETAEHARGRFVERGVTLAVDEGYSAGTKDFHPLIERMRAAKIKSLLMYGYDEMGLLARQLRQLGLNLQLYSFGTVTSPGFIESAQGSAEGAIIAAWQGEGGKLLEKFLEAFNKRVGRAPFVHISTLPSYDVTNLLAQCFRSGAVETPGGTVKPDKLRSCLYGIEGYSGISGRITIDEDGVTRSFSHVLDRLHGSRLEPLSER